MGGKHPVVISNKDESECSLFENEMLSSNEDYHGVLLGLSDHAGKVRKGNIMTAPGRHAKTPAVVVHVEF